MSDTPKQIDNVVGIDRMDSLDRQKLDPRIKLQLLCAEAKAVYARDPRAGGMVFVARPRIVLQLLLDILKNQPILTLGAVGDVRLQRPVVAGVVDADIVGWWEGVPIVVRCTVADDRLHCILEDKLPDSQQIDRRRAGELRMHAHAGSLQNLREGDN